jgi:hypothetical protein
MKRGEEQQDGPAHFLSYERASSWPLSEQEKLSESRMGIRMADVCIIGSWVSKVGMQCCRHLLRFSDENQAVIVTMYVDTAMIQRLTIAFTVCAM